MRAPKTDQAFGIKKGSGKKMKRKEEQGQMKEERGKGKEEKGKREAAPRASAGRRRRELR